MTTRCHCNSHSFLLGVPVSSGFFWYPLQVVSPNPKHLASTKLGDIDTPWGFLRRWHIRSMASTGRRCFISLQLFGDYSSEKDVKDQWLPGNWTETSFKEALNFFTCSFWSFSCIISPGRKQEQTTFKTATACKTKRRKLRFLEPMGEKNRRLPGYTTSIVMWCDDHVAAQ